MSKNTTIVVQSDDNRQERKQKRRKYPKSHMMMSTMPSAYPVQPHPQSHRYNQHDDDEIEVRFDSKLGSNQFNHLNSLSILMSMNQQRMYTLIPKIQCKLQKISG